MTPCDIFFMKTPLFPKGKGQTNHADACEKFVCPNTTENLYKMHHQTPVCPDISLISLLTTLFLIIIYEKGFLSLNEI